MTIALWCVFVAGILPILCTGMAKAGAKGFDNRSPREWLATQEGWRRRASAAQANSWEAFAVFSAGVLVAHVAGATQSTVDTIAVAFLVARALYIACYLGDKSTLRSLVWLAGFALSLSLYFLAPFKTL